MSVSVTQEAHWYKLAPAVRSTKPPAPQGQEIQFDLFHGWTNCRYHSQVHLISPRNKCQSSFGYTCNHSSTMRAINICARRNDSAAATHIGTLHHSGRSGLSPRPFCITHAASQSPSATSTMHDQVEQKLCPSVDSTDIERSCSRDPLGSACVGFGT